MHKKIFIAIFMIIIIVPFLAMPFYKTDMSVEKRYAKTFPQFYESGKINLGFFDELTEYFSDNFAFRQELATADAVMKSKVFSSSNNDKVIVGKNGWLYFNETMDDYLGRNMLSSRGIHNCTKVVELLQEGAKKKDCDFLFVVAPNKNSVYPQNMPSRFVKENEINNYKLLKEELADKNINTVDLHKAFQENDTVMYHKLDTHWNNEGAVYARNLMFNQLGKEYTDYENVEKSVENNFVADLQGMLYPKQKKYDDNVIYDKEHTYTYSNRVKSTEDMMIETACEGKENSVIMFRDSFGNALLPYIADEYQTGYFTKSVPYDLSLIDEYEADTVIIELVERHIPSLQEELPIMEAPLRDIDTKAIYEDNNTTLYMDDGDSSLIVYGNVDEKYIGDDGNVYVHFYSGDNSYVFEAFPTAYSGTENVKKSDFCYAMNLNYNILKVGDYSIEVITEKNGEKFTSGNLSSLEIQ